MSFGPPRRFPRPSEPGHDRRAGIHPQGRTGADATVLEMVRDRKECLQCAGGFLLDGFPRTVAQAEALAALLVELGMKLDTMLDFFLPVDEIVARLSGRRTCAACKPVFHVTGRPPKVEGVCDHCGGQLIQREDDRAETVRVRMEAYNRSTAPLTDYFRKQGLLVRVDSPRHGGRDVRRTLKLLGKLTALSVSRAHVIVGCVKRTVAEMVGSGTMYPWSRSRTLANTHHSSGPVRVTHHFAGFRAPPTLRPPRLNYTVSGTTSARILLGEQLVGLGIVDESLGLGVDLERAAHAVGRLVEVHADALEVPLDHLERLGDVRIAHALGLLAEGDLLAQAVGNVAQVAECGGVMAVEDRGFDRLGLGEAEATSGADRLSGAICIIASRATDL